MEALVPQRRILVSLRFMLVMRPGERYIGGILDLHICRSTVQNSVPLKVHRPKCTYVPRSLSLALMSWTKPTLMSLAVVTLLALSGLSPASASTTWELGDHTEPTGDPPDRCVFIPGAHDDQGTDPDEATVDLICASAYARVSASGGQDPHTTVTAKFGGYSDVLPSLTCDAQTSHWGPQFDAGQWVCGWDDSKTVDVNNGDVIQASVTGTACAAGHVTVQGIEIHGAVACIENEARHERTMIVPSEFLDDLTG